MVSLSNKSSRVELINVGVNRNRWVVRVQVCRKFGCAQNFGHRIAFFRPRMKRIARITSQGHARPNSLDSCHSWLSSITKRVRQIHSGFGCAQNFVHRSVFFQPRIKRITRITSQAHARSNSLDSWLSPFTKRVRQIHSSFGCAQNLVHRSDFFQPRIKRIRRITSQTRARPNSLDSCDSWLSRHRGDRVAG